MMVLFISRSDKQALKTTRQILDAFAERIGDAAWRTVITEDGLERVKILLRSKATKSMAVACHRLRGNKSELLWIVGARDRFGDTGIVPVNTTSKNISHSEWENNWQYLPALKALTAVAALLHDWGKANDIFQNKLRSNDKIGDAYRHEWLSTALLNALVAGRGDEQWLGDLAAGHLDEKAILDRVSADELPLAQLPPVAQLVAILILSHHHLPGPEVGVSELHGYGEQSSLSDILGLITSEWGYSRDTQREVSFSAGLLANSTPWAKELKKWGSRLGSSTALLSQLVTTGKVRVLLTLARTALMLADHGVSGEGCDEGKDWNTELFANTNKANGKLSQRLDEHLVRVAKRALTICHHLPGLETHVERVEDNRALKRKSPELFAWQDRTVTKIREQRNEDNRNGKTARYFVINMASTGCGKTMANAKIAAAISADGQSLRYTLAVGLRTLTLQTGDEYRNRIGLTEDELAVLIGSVAVRDLHEKDRDTDNDTDTLANEELLPITERFTPSGAQEYIEEMLPVASSGDKKRNDRQAEAGAKDQAFIYKPLVVATIDHIMPAVTTWHGGRHLLPILRLLTSDLVIDEIDDFCATDLLAIARLVHLAGMFGRNVVISSATIPPDLACGMLTAYQAGLREHDRFWAGNTAIHVAYCDEFRACITDITATANAELRQQFGTAHEKFAKYRVDRLRRATVKRRACVVPTADLIQLPFTDRRINYYERIADTIRTMHKGHCLRDHATGKRVSIGLVRMANIDPCIELGLYLQKNGLSDPESTVHVIIYHSRQPLMLRHALEHYLDHVLRRKGMPVPSDRDNAPEVDITDAVLRSHIDAAATTNVIFVLVATPVEEVGRDHDLDWAIVEPSSSRSLIQLAGRVLRHRNPAENMTTPNIAVLEHNLRGLQEEHGGYAFTRPGFEDGAHRLATHSVTTLLRESELTSVDAVPRVLKNKPLKPESSLSDLEHRVMEEFASLEEMGPEHLHGAIAESWYLTTLQRRLNPFRESSPTVNLYYCYRDGELEFTERDRYGDYIPRDSRYGISTDDAVDDIGGWWLIRSYVEELRAMAGDNDSDQEIARLSRLYGEIHILASDDNRVCYSYSDVYGLYRKREARLPWESW